MKNAKDMKMRILGGGACGGLGDLGGKKSVKKAGKSEE
jgi:hypothetical protein